MDDVTQKVEGVANDVQAVGDIPLLKNGVVKSVQRGFSKSVELPQKERTKVATIAEVKPEKSVLICNYKSSVGNDRVTLSGLILEKDGIYVERYYTGGYWAYIEELSWQVVEFY